MTLHQHLPIYKLAVDLLDLAVDLTRNMPRDFKASLGAEIRSELIKLIVLIGRANAAADGRAQHADADGGLCSTEGAAQDRRNEVTTMTQLTIPDAELDVLQWAERCAEGAQKQLLESAKILADQASTTMTLLLAGIGGAMGLSVKLFESAPFTASATPPTPTSIGASFVCVYLVILAVLLLRNCIAVGPIPLTYNEPAHLVQAGWTLKQLLPVELEHRQTTINALKLRNKVRGAWLNRIRLAAAVGAPLAFLVGALCAR